MWFIDHDFVQDHPWTVSIVVATVLVIGIMAIAYAVTWYWIQPE